MNRKSLVLTASVLAALASLAVPAGDAEAYTYLSPKRVWDALPVMIDINTTQKETSITDGNYGVNRLVAEMDTTSGGWNSEVPGLIDGYTTNTAAALGDGYPTITFNDPQNYCTGSCLAVTLTGYWSYSAGWETINDADIYVDNGTVFTSEAEDPTSSSCSWGEYYIEGVMIHEIGHVLGLGHSGSGPATMYSSVGACNIGLDEIATDDRTAIQALY